jgi:phosphopantetheinyl transferase (holo-ACP synthase)
MEQEIQVKTVEDKQETSPQEKEAAVLETAVKEGEVNPDYGLQDDGVYKVNLDNPPKQKQDAVQEQSTDEVPVRDGSEAGQEVQEKNEEKPKESSEQSKKEEDKEEKIESPIELVTDEAKEDPTEPIEDIVEEEKVSTEENKNIEYPENIQKLVEFMDETGGTLEDYVSLNKDYSKMDATALIYDYYKTTKPHLDNEDVSFLMQKEFQYSEDEDEPQEIKAKQLAFKEELYKAQTHFKNSKEKYYTDLKLRKQNNVPEEYKKAYDFYNEAIKSEELTEKNKKSFISKTNKVFGEEFKGFDFKVGDKKYRYKVENSKKVKQTQSDISNFLGKYLDDNGNMHNPQGYHKAIFAAENVDKIASHFYEQGRADAIQQSIKESKNINMSPRADASASGNFSNNPVKVVASESSNKLRIKWNK